jgi:catechol 2,3-dioxygenase-like lactoylglutathione lyase family enzyme
MRVVATTMAGPMRHYFFEISPQNTVAFFEVKGAETFDKGAGSPPPNDIPVQMDHLSFNLPDEASLEQLRKRILAAGSEVTEVVDHGFIRSVYFTDPNGIALEASWWVVDATGRPADYDDRILFSDPNPVPAVSELRTGSVGRLPETELT